MDHPGVAKPRLESLDVLRGLGVLGIFVMNAQAFAMVPQAYSNPWAHMTFGSVEQAIWAVQQTVFAGKFLTIFSMLFGAGLMLQLGDAPEQDIRARYRRRLFWLLIFGLLHGFVLWWGDILAPYALAGFLAMACVRWSATRLAVTAAALFGLYLVIVGAGMAALLWLPEAEQDTALRDLWAPTLEDVETMVGLYRLDIIARWPSHAMENLEMLGAQLVIAPTRILAAMLAGMALMKWGVFAPQREHVSPLALVGLACVAAGWALDSWTVMQRLALGADYAANIPWVTLQEATSPITAMGYGALVIALCQSGSLRAVRDALGRLGRVAFTGYILSSVLGVFVFYGAPGLGLIGAIERPGQVAVTLVVWAILLISAGIWTRTLGAGPLERLWRWLAGGGASTA